MWGAVLASSDRLAVTRPWRCPQGALPTSPRQSAWRLRGAEDQAFICKSQLCGFLVPLLGLVAVVCAEEGGRVRGGGRRGEEGALSAFPADPKAVLGRCGVGGGRGAWLPGRAGGLLPAPGLGLRPQGRDLLGSAEPLIQPGHTSPLLPPWPPPGRARTLDLRRMTPHQQG